ncbi:prostate-associated microseminoprotein isoform X2 [Paramormyrops kingsleyae]|uniref:prostate-associated microseminoprotein isoform X2 n=1 Tax=Paramormyrops kingsleyae TaxID=1676925 RepID=UPI000CD64A20|nr:prostate-associated microseminoprotein isoform X2 [Paramormyrops kingsleyae]
MSAMAGQLALALLMGTVLWTTCPGAPTQCHFNFRASCQYQGTFYSLGESWTTAECLQCTCLHPVGVGCCETVQHPVDFPAWCEVRVEPETCRATLVQTADPRLPCVSSGEDNLDPKHRTLPISLGV